MSRRTRVSSLDRPHRRRRARFRTDAVEPASDRSFLDPTFAVSSAVRHGVYRQASSPLVHPFFIFSLFLRRATVDCRYDFSADSAAHRFCCRALRSPLVRGLAWRFEVVDHPVGARKMHGRDVALLGGVAVFIALLAGIAAAIWAGWLPDRDMKAQYIVGIVIALAAALVFGGALDDAFNLRPRWQIVWPVLRRSRHRRERHRRHLR